METETIDIITLMKKNQLEVSDSRNYGKLSLLNYSLLSKYITEDFLHSDKCVFYNGQFIKGLAIYTYKAKKVSLNRLLYINFVRALSDDEVVKLPKTCDYRCCNVNHFKILNKKKGSCEGRKGSTIVCSEPVKTTGTFILGLEY